MSRNAKALLILSIICLLLGGALNTGLIDAHGLAPLYVILPLGAVFLGLFLIALILPKEGEAHPGSRDSSQPTARGAARDVADHS